MVPNQTNVDGIGQSAWWTWIIQNAYIKELRIRQKQNVNDERSLLSLFRGSSEKKYFCMIFWDWHRRVVNVHVQSESTKAKLMWNFQVFALLNLRFTFCVCKYHSRSLSRVKKMQKSKLTIEPTENRERDWGMTRSLKNVVKKANGEVREESFRRRHIASTSFSWWWSSNLIGWMEEVHQLNSTSTPARTTFSTIQECRSLTLILLLVRCKLHKFLDLTRALNINLILDFHSSFVLHFRCLLPSSSTASLLICLHEFCCKIYSRFRIFVFKKPLTPRRTRLDVVSRSHVLSRRTQAFEATKAKHNTTHSAQAKAQQRPEMTRRDEEISKRKPEKNGSKTLYKNREKKWSYWERKKKSPIGIGTSFRRVACSFAAVRCFRKIMIHKISSRFCFLFIFFSLTTSIRSIRSRRSGKKYNKISSDGQRCSFVDRTESNTE